MRPSQYLKIGIFALLAGCSNNNLNESARIDRINAINRRTQYFLQINALDSAGALVNQALLIDSNNFVAYNNRAVLKAKLGQPEKDILADFQKCLRINPNYGLAVFSLANYYFNKGDYMSCIHNATRYLDLSMYQNQDKNMLHDIYAIRGESEQYLIQFDDAIIDLNKAIELDVTDRGCHKDLADCYYYTGRLKMSIDEYTQAIRLDTNYLQAYFGRAMCYEAIGESNLAKLDYRKALAINPNAEDIYRNRSRIFMREKTRVLIISRRQQKMQ